MALFKSEINMRHKKFRRNEDIGTTFFSFYLSDGLKSVATK